MDTLLRMEAEEINESFIQFIRQSFKGKRIALHIYEETQDETDYLLSNPENKRRLLQSAEDVKNNISLKEISLSDMQNILNDNGE
jgi:antitoxin YefM